MEPTRRPEDETQLNKTPEEQVKAPEPQETAYSLEEIMNEFGGWTKRERAAGRGACRETVRSRHQPDESRKNRTAPAAVAGDTIRFAPVHDEQKKPEPERPAVWTYQGEPDPEPPASDPKEAREQRPRRAPGKAAGRKAPPPARTLPEKRGPEKARRRSSRSTPFASLEAAYQFYAAASGIAAAAARERAAVPRRRFVLLVLSTPAVIGGVQRLFRGLFRGHAGASARAGAFVAMTSACPA